MSDTRIRLRVRSADGREHAFPVSATDPFQGIMQRYAEVTEQDQAGIAFTYEGTRLLSTSTPHELKMSDDDLIQAETAPEPDRQDS
ncbi:hypothetical protein G3I40_30540 [Streptomyces sp. SID14478]|uniref:sumo domain-containing protein n=1 Tax=Streptomyces sp. SID14478 TaxID=2706073 RepID=UPI0013D92381|nr:sumo domain-containing protein [Streptomyces sp. SID14478]NEB79524.1 hypothetical protein [Streptomyces sp. SID14478]